MDLDLDEVWLLQAFPCNVASGRGDTPLHDAAMNGQWQRSGCGAAARGQCTGGREKRGRPGASVRSDATRSGPSWRVTVYLEIGIHRSLQQKSHFVKTGVHIFRV